MENQITWCDFHAANKGFNFKDKKTGEVFTKLEIYFQYRRNPTALKLFTANKYPGYCHIDKEGWKNGERITDT